MKPKDRRRKKGKAIKDWLKKRLGRDWQPKSKRGPAPQSKNLAS